MKVYDVREVPLPTDRPILVYCNKWDIDEFYYGYEQLFGHNYYPPDITHWCELPPPPLKQ